jgi:aminodeoxyfutalosine deaminase
MRTSDCNGKCVRERNPGRKGVEQLFNHESALQSNIMTAAGAQPPKAFIHQLPKAELHLHLEGAVEPATLFELRKQHGETTTLAETEALYRYSDFASFLMAFKEVSAHLREADDYEFITYRLMQQLKEENVLHAEVYVSVGVCLYRKQDFAAIFEGLERGRTRGARDFGVSLLWTSASAATR